MSENVDEMINKLIVNAKKAGEEMLKLNQEQVDEIVRQMAISGMEAHMSLAKMAIEETHRGVFEDKVTKNMFATEYIYHSIKNDKTVGVISENEYEGYEEVAEPVGIIAGVTPVTNPTSTAMYKSIISMKTRNPIIFGFHPSAQKSSAEAARIVRDAAIKAGAPENCIQWIIEPSIDATHALMYHPDVKLILATGGAGMVKAAYSSGKPALGVGPGNVPCYIEKTANVKRAVTDLILSKTFDNGMICASEQSVIVDKDIQKEFEDFMKLNKCYFLSDEEVAFLTESCINKEKGCAINADIVGQSASIIAKRAGIKVPEGTKILVAPLKGVGIDYPLSKEKLSPILAYYIVHDYKEGIAQAEKIIAFGGLGHSAVIHSKSDEIIDEFSVRMKAGRIIVNSPSTHGAIGDIYNANLPSLTLGCGSYGGNSTTENVSAVNLINKKRVAKRRVNMQWVKIPEKIFFERGSLQYLSNMLNISRAFVVTDPSMVKLGFVEKVEYYLRKRETPVQMMVFSEVEPDPSFDTIRHGVKEIEMFKPDVIIALGGGSAIDAAKGMWMYYERPDVDINALKTKFMDIRKRAYQIPPLGKKAKLVAIPTTSGTGSEVTSFAVITDKEKNIKYPLTDYELTPDVAIIDPDLVMTVPSKVVADTGMDVLTHAIEAYVSVMASDYTDALATRAIQLVFENLENSYKDATNLEAREKMHNASCMAGMAFTNAFLGINHSMAHKLGGEFHVAHGRANAILLPYTIQYNSELPTKFASFPKYETFKADVKYAEIAHTLGLPSDTVQEGVKSLIKAVNDLRNAVGIPATLQEEGVNETEFLAKLDTVAENAFEDQCTTANPRLPLVSELKGILQKAYYGEK